jgi:hypothetical protein
MKHFRILLLAAACAGAGSLTHSAAAQATPAAQAVTPPDADDDISPVTATPAAATPAPLVVNWGFKHGTAGNMNLTVNPDGTWLFSGQYTGHKKNKDFDITLALKASTGAIMLFRFAGDSANGTQWSKQGKSSFLSDDFSLFAGNVHWHAAYHFSESAAGRRAAYEARERKREEAWKKYEDAKARKDAKLEAENKALLDQLKHEDAQDIAQAQQAPASGGGGGGGAGSIVNSAVSALGGIMGGGSGGGGGGALSSIEGALGSIF